MLAGNFDIVRALTRNCWILLFAPALAAQPGAPSFEADVRPVLASRCLGCHNAKLRQGGLSLETKADLFAGADSGPVIVPGHPADSLLLTMVSGGMMPKAGPKLTPEQIETIRRWIAAGETPPPAAAAPVTAKVSERDIIMPILGAKCFVCHGRRVQRGGLDLRTRASMLKGGKSGRAIVPGKPDESLLVRMIAEQKMPPPKLQEQFSVRGLTSDEFDKLKQWIASGAPGDESKSGLAEGSNDPLIKPDDRRFWAFRPPVRPAVPAVAGSARVRNPIDAFLLQKLENRHLSFSAEADRLALLRRVSLDLTGLPPTPDDVEAYLADRRPDAYERMVDRLLASPRYGERWARYWLDAAGYADSEGAVSADSIRPHAWRYRDYVIRSLNADKPYDRFLREQIAGDELFDYRAAREYTPEQIDSLAATGFLRMAPDSTYSTEQNYLPERFDVIANEIDVLSSSVMGLTVACARCHNHKFDPIPQRDYYRLSAVFETAYDPYDWRVPNMDVVGVGAKPDEALTRLLPLKSTREQQDVERQNEPTRAAIAGLEKQIAAKAAPFREKLLAERLAALPESVRADLRKALSLPEENRTEVQQYLLKNFASTIQISDKDLDSRFEEFHRDVAELRKQVQAEKQKLVPEPRIRALFDMGGDPTPNYLLLRGDVRTPGQLVAPGVLSVLSEGLAPYRVRRPDFQTGTSGRRLALAQWLSQPGHPLTARVMVNRIWQHHFGKGLVATPGNFGRTGLAPSHPELLDWLATEFVRQGWSIKAMHRLILTSAAYRQSSRAQASQLEGDPDNALLSRFPLVRLDGDALRDSILKIGGRLDEKAFGPPAPFEERPDGEVVSKAARQGHRRSIYLLTRRSTPVTVLDVFDAPQLNPNCLKRSQSTVSSQALELSNDDLVRENARFLAGRILDDVGADLGRQVARAYLHVLARPAKPEEIAAGRRALNELMAAWRKGLENEVSAEPKSAKAQWMALATFCHTLFNSAEFLYVD